MPADQFLLFLAAAAEEVVIDIINEVESWRRLPWVMEHPGLTYHLNDTVDACNAEYTRRAREKRAQAST